MNYSPPKSLIPKLFQYIVIGFVLALGIYFAGMTRAAAAGKPLSPKAQRGEAIFKAQCIGCHSKPVGDTTLFGPPNLHGILSGSKPLTPVEVKDTITHGKNIMPPFGGKLSTTEIDEVVAYLKTQ